MNDILINQGCGTGHGDPLCPHCSSPCVWNTRGVNQSIGLLRGFSGISGQINGHKSELAPVSLGWCSRGGFRTDPRGLITYSHCRALHLHDLRILIHTTTSSQRPLSPVLKLSCGPPWLMLLSLQINHTTGMDTLSSNVCFISFNKLNHYNLCFVLIDVSRVDIQNIMNRREI